MGEKTKGDILPYTPELTEEALRELLGRHPLIHELELSAAFDRKDRTELIALIHLLESEGEITRQDGFIRYQDVIGRQSVI